MRIAFVAQPIDTVLPPHQNSVGISVYEAARRLRKQDDVDHVTVFCRGTGAWSTRRHFRDGVEYCEINMRPDGLLLRALKLVEKAGLRRAPLFASPLYFLGYAIQVALRLRRKQFDVINVYNFSQFLPWFGFAARAAKIVIHMRCEWLAQLSARQVRRRLRCADLVVGCSAYIAGQIKDRFPEYAGKIISFFNGVDCSRFTPAPPRNLANAKTVLLVGRMSPEKGVHDLVEAFEQVAEVIPDARLQIVGGDTQLPRSHLLDFAAGDPLLAPLIRFYRTDSRREYYRYVCEEIRARNLEHAIEFTGQLPYPEVIARYQQAAVAVNCSRSEPLGRSNFEAMACGVPVVAASAGGNAEIVIDGETGLVVEPGNPAALAGAIISLLSDDEKRARMALAARARAVTHFSWAIYVKNLSSCYKTLFSTNAGPVRRSLNAHAGEIA